MSPRGSSLKSRLIGCTSHTSRVSGAWLRRAVAALLVLAAVACLAASSEKQLAPQYKKWLNHDVVYLISKEERDAFLLLKADAERDQAIETFWAVRNPNPGAPTNQYKEEIFRRIEYANQYFGVPGQDDGWNTDRGRVYITLGEPQQKAPYYGRQEVRPMEIWFYQNANPALPPFFYVIFYQRDIGGDFRLYSPSFDGPDKLATSSFTINNRAAAFHEIDRTLGREVARTTLSLIPGEPVDIDRATSSLSSDLMLSVLKNLANNPLTKEQIARNRDLLANVSHRLVLGGDYLDLVTATLRDREGAPNLHFAVRFVNPQDFAVQRSGERFSYSVELVTRVFDTNNRLLLQRDNPVADYLTANQMEDIKGKTFGVEGMLPLPPGTYRVNFELTNKVNQTAYRLEKSVVVAEPPAKGLWVSEIVPFSNAEATHGTSPVLPFGIAGVKFEPRLGDGLVLAQGQDIKIMYQIWSQPGDPARNQGKKLAVEYSYGRPGVSGDAKELQDEVPREEFDASGSLVHGKTIPTKDLAPGNYRLIVKVVDPEAQQKAFSSTSFRIADALSATSVPWDVWDDKGTVQQQLSAHDYDRGWIYLQRGDAALATRYFERALQESGEDQKARAVLAHLYYTQAKYQAVVELYSHTEIDKSTEDGTLLDVADSFAKVGDTPKAIHLLETALGVRTQSEPVYLALASYYEKAGDSGKAAELRKKAAAVDK
jgi:GWxTD domain-containing protein